MNASYYFWIGVVLGLTSLLALSIMAYWWITTRGGWWDWLAGRSLMGLLAILAALTGNSALNSFFFPGPNGYPGKSIISIGLYAIFVVALAVIGLTIRRELLRGRTRQIRKHQKEPSND